jgi:hypothetical protein
MRSKRQTGGLNKTSKARVVAVAVAMERASHHVLAIVMRYFIAVRKMRFSVYNGSTSIWKRNSSALFMR